MSNADRNFSQQAAPESHSDQGTGDAGELKRLLNTIGDQIAGADRRHEDALRDMQDRLEQLGADARQLQSESSPELASAFDRIEDSMAVLAQKISAVAVPARQPQPQAADVPAAVHASPTYHTDSSRYSLENAPMPLRSAAGPGAAFRAPSSPDVDPFDVVDVSVPGNASEPWDEASAEALTRTYESGHVPEIAAPAASDPMLQTDAQQAETEPEAPLAASRSDLPEHSAADPTDLLVQHTHWLEERFADIAVRIEQSFAEMRPDHTIAALGERFDQFEQRLGSAFEEVATRTDLDGLKALEANIEELARHVEETHAQLQRLDAIEAQLQEVVAQLSDERMTHFMGPQGAVLPDADDMAARVASAAATRIAEIARGGDDADSIAEMKSLLMSFVDEQRLGDEHTNSMLDTMQQALIRVLDRMDAMEVAYQKPAAAPVARDAERRVGPAERRGLSDEIAADVETEAAVAAVAAAPVAAVAAAAVHPAYSRLSPAAAAQQTGPVPHMQPQPAPVPVQGAVPQPVPQAQPPRFDMEEQLPAMAVPSTPIEKMRQDFIQEARRAKLKAASEAEGPPAGAPDLKAVRASVNAATAAAAAKAAEAAPAEEKAGYKKIFGLSPKLIVGALALIVAVNGALLFMQRKPAPKLQQPAATMSAPVPKTAPAPQQAQPEPAAPAEAAPLAPAASGKQSQAEPEPGLPPAPSADRLKMPAPSGNPDLSQDTVDSIMLQQQKMIIDGTTLSVPTGINLRRSPDAPTGAEIDRIQQQQAMAETSSQLAMTMIKATPAAFLTASAGSAVPQPASLAVPAAVQPPAAPATTALNTADLPPATVGPLSLRIAAAKGDASAQFEVASRLAEGKGTDQNFKEATRWYQRSASQGFAQAQYRLGTLYERGLGVRKDLGMARSWYERAADQGNVKAMHNLAVLAAGQENGAPDYQSAARWFGEAAEHNLPDSQYNLAVLAENGLGITKDLKAAYKWYSLAAKGGDREALRHRDELRAQLSGSELSAAEDLLQKFEPRKPDLLANDARVAGEQWKKRQDTADANG